MCTGEFPPDPQCGGMGSSILAAAAALTQAGHEVHVLHSAVNQPRVDVEHELGFTLHTRSIARSALRLFGRSGLAQAAAFRWHASKLGRFDVVEAPDWEAVVSGFVVLRRQPVVAYLATPTAITRAHGSTHGNRRREWFERWGCRRADARCSVGEPLSISLVELGWFDALSAVPIRPPCLLPELVAVDEVAMNETPMILAAGRFEPRKGFDLLIETAAKLKQPVSVVAIGSDTVGADGQSCVARLQHLAAKRGVDLTIVDAVSLTDMSVWYSRCWALVVPSTFESFSMVAMEAAAHYRTIVGSPSVGFVQLGSDSPGVLSLPREPEVWAAALDQILESRHEAVRRGRAAREFAMRHCAPATFAAQRGAIYEQITAR